MRHVLAALLFCACGKVQGTPPADSPPIESCTPDQFVRCDGTIAQICNGAGDGADPMDCGAPGCNEVAARCNQCAPDTLRCDDRTVETCGADGLVAATENCSLSCTDAPTAHCSYLEPNYVALADICDTPAAMAALDITANQTLDSNADALVCTGGVITQVGGPPICVLRFDQITVQANRTLTFTGSRAVALVADSALIVDGIIDVSANSTTNGPGGGSPSSGDRANSTIGGGGAGFRTAGANGGSDAANGGGAAGGAARTNPADLVAFVGGPRPQVPITLDAIPGGGGGALTLIACRGAVTISATGLIDAGGGGGRGGFDQIAGAQILVTSAAGGGAGGNVVLQGLDVVVNGQLYANGGAGGGGTSSNDPATGVNGEDGRRSTTAAIGGPASGSGGAGGAGGTSNVPTVGLASAQTAGTPGGGGASAGFLQIYTPTGVTPTVAPVTTSPGFSSSRSVGTR